MTVLTFVIPLTRGSRGAWPTSQNHRLIAGRHRTREATDWQQTVHDYAFAEYLTLSTADKDALHNAERLRVHLRWCFGRLPGRKPDRDNIFKDTLDGLKVALAIDDARFEPSGSIGDPSEPASLTVTVEPVGEEE